MLKFFRHPYFSETMKSSPTNFLALWDKIFSTQNRDNLPPLPLSLMHNFFPIKNFLKNRRDHLRSFSFLWSKFVSTENCDIPFLMHKNLQYPKFSETLSGCPTVFFGTVRREKVSTQESVFSFFCTKFFDTRTFPKTWKVRPRNLLALWDKTFPTERRKIIILFPLLPLISYPYFFHTKILLKHRKDPFRCLSVRWDQKNSTKPWCSPSPMQQNVRYWTFSNPERFA